MLPRCPAEPGRTCLPTACTGGTAILRRCDPALGRASTGRHGISWWLRWLSRYHGSLRTGRDGSCKGREVVAKLLAAKPWPATLALLAHAHTAACPTPGPRYRPVLKQC
jgi:hypothetical protein